MALPLGICIGIGTHTNALLQDTLPKTPDTTLWVTLMSNSGVLFAFGTLLAVACGQSFLRGIIVFSLERRNREKELRGIQNLAFRKIFRGACLSVFFEVTYWLALLLIAFAFAIPCLIAWRFNPSALPAILEVGSLLLMTIGVYLYFIKELSVFYAILANVHVQTAIDLGFRLFRRQAFNTILFFFYAALLAICFSMLAEGLIASVKIPKTDVSWGMTLVRALPLGIYFIFDQALRLMFFRAIATTPKKPITEEAALKPSERPSGAASS